MCILDFKARRRLEERERERLCELYLARHDRITTWDMVDRSAPRVVGGKLADTASEPLFELAAADAPLRRRTATTATLYFVWAGTDDDLATGFAIAGRLATDPEPVVHNAVGIFLKHAGTGIPTSSTGSSPPTPPPCPDQPYASPPPNSPPKRGPDTGRERPAETRPRSLPGRETLRSSSFGDPWAWGSLGRAIPLRTPTACSPVIDQRGSPCPDPTTSSSGCRPWHVVGAKQSCPSRSEPRHRTVRHHARHRLPS
jgi:hypothetical protein